MSDRADGGTSGISPRHSQLGQFKNSHLDWRSICGSAYEDQFKHDPKGQLQALSEKAKKSTIVGWDGDDDHNLGAYDYMCDICLVCIQHGDQGGTIS